MFHYFLSEVILPGMRLESSAFFFVSHCANLTEEQLSGIKDDFLKLLTAEGICTTSGNLQCHLEDAAVHCGENDYDGHIVKRDTAGEVLIIDYALVLEGKPLLQSACSLACSTREECERCLWVYKINATRLLKHEHRRVRQLLLRTMTDAVARSAVSFLGSLIPITYSPDGPNLGGLTLRLHGVSVSSVIMYCDLGTTNIGGRCGKHVLTSSVIKLLVQ